MKDFSSRLQQLIILLGIEQQELATVAGVHETTITQYKKGKTLPRFEVLAAWSRKYHVNLHWLMLDEGPIFRSGPDPDPVQAAGESVSLSVTPPQAPICMTTTDPIAQRVEVVAREMRAAGASDEAIQDAICRALDGRPALSGRYSTNVSERREGFGKVAEAPADYPAEAEAERT